MAGGFNVNTRRKIIQLADIPYPASGGITYVNLPKVGMLARVWLAVRGTVGGTVNAANALGFSSVINRFRLTANSSIDIYNVSGAGNSYIVSNMLESEYFNIQGQNQGTTAVTAATFNLDTMIPVMLNLRDPIGLVMLQNEQTIVTLVVDFNSPTNVGGSTATIATGSGVTVTPYLEVFTVPVSPQDWPPMNVIHQILEDTVVVSGAGDNTYYWPRGNTYLQVAHGAGMGVSGADSFNKVQWRVNQSDNIESDSKGTFFQDLEYRAFRGRARPAGTIFFDLMGSSGLGNYGQQRDLFNSALVTDVESVITWTGSGTQYNERRQLVVLQ